MRKSGVWALKGKIVTLDHDSTVLEGYVVIEDHLIVDICKSLSDTYINIEIIEIDGVIYPGMIDLHNHLAYNMLPLWQIPSIFKSRADWRSRDDYKTSVRLPTERIINQHQKSINYVVKYVEGKAIIGGITSGQGLGYYDGNNNANIYQGAMRNVEAPGHAFLAPAFGNVNDMLLENKKSPNIESFQKIMSNGKIKCFLHHLSEGLGPSSRIHYETLKNNHFVQKKLVGVHSLALEPQDIMEMAAAGAKIVWSPFSNLLLYGETLKLKPLKDSEILFSIGCDWSPSGSKNLLQEIKIAHQCNIDQGNLFTVEELVRAVTINPAKILGWEKDLGTIQANKICDLVVLDNIEEDVYLNLLNAREEHIRLVLIDGIARHGSVKLMEQFPQTEGFGQEEIMVNGVKKKMDLYATGLPLNHITFSESRTGLREILSDLKKFDQNDQKFPQKEFVASFFDKKETRFRLMLDEDDDDAVSDKEDVLAMKKPFDDQLEPQNQITLDEPVVGGKEYLETIKNEIRLPQTVKDAIAKYYGHLV